MGWSDVNLSCSMDRAFKARSRVLSPELDESCLRARINSSCLSALSWTNVVSAISVSMVLECIGTRLVRRLELSDDCCGWVNFRLWRRVHYWQVSHGTIRFKDVPITSACVPFWFCLKNINEKFFFKCHKRNRHFRHDNWQTYESRLVYQIIFYANARRSYIFNNNNR